MFVLMNIICLHIYLLVYAMVVVTLYSMLENTIIDISGILYNVKIYNFEKWNQNKIKT